MDAIKQTMFLRLAIPAQGVVAVAIGLVVIIAPETVTKSQLVGLLAGVAVLLAATPRVVTRDSAVFQK